MLKNTICRLKNIFSGKLLNVLVVLLVISALISLSPQSVYAEDVPSLTYAESVYLYCVTTNTVLYGKNTDLAVYPASCVKMMTALLAIESYHDTDRKILVTDELLSGSDGTGYGFKNGNTVTEHDLLATLVLGNANDAAIIIANDISGSEEAFVLKMNKRAKELGMNSTEYKNPTGINNPEALTTASDVAKLALVLKENATYMKYSQYPSETLDMNGKRVYNRNYFNGKYYTEDYYSTVISGLNAGMTNDVGYVCVSTYIQKGMEYLCIVMGAKEADGRIQSYVISKNMFTWAVNNFKYVEVLSSSTVFTEIPVLYGNKTDHAAVFADRSISVHLPSDVDVKNDLNVEYELFYKKLEAPVDQGMEVGSVSVYYNDELVASTALIIPTTISRNKLSAFWTTVGIIFAVVLILSITGFAVFVIIMRKKRNKSRKRRMKSNVNIKKSDM